MGATPLKTDLHIDRYLTNYSMSWQQDETNFVSNKASSVISVNKQSDKYLEILRGDMWRDEVGKRPLGGRPPMTSYRTSSGSYSAEEYGLETGVDDRQRTNADEPLSLERAATRLLTQQHMIRKDREWSSKFFVTSAWTQEWTGVAAAPGASQFLQFDQSGSNPFEVFDELQDLIGGKTGFRPNTIVAGTDVRRVLRSHPEVQAVMSSAETKIAQDARLAALFGVDNFITPRSVYNSAAEGQTDSIGYIHGAKSCWIGYIDPNPTLDSPTAIATFAWTGLMAGANAMGGVMMRTRDDRAHSDIFQMGMAWDMKIIAQDLGYFLATAVG